MGVGYGQLHVDGVFTANASPLLIRVDGETRDTLTTERPFTARDIILATGDHEVILVNGDTKDVLRDTTITIEAAKTASFPKFFYTGTAALFDESIEKPEKDSMLVRLITLDPALPDVMDITISLYDYGSINIPLTTKRINGVRKDRFSGFVQLPDPFSLVPPDVPWVLYALEGYEAGTNNKVMDIVSGTNSYIVFNSGEYFKPNAVISMGIGPSSAPVEIFHRIVE